MMAYSFTEPLPEETGDSDCEDEVVPVPTPMMVPMADALNHIAKNNAHLDFGVDALQMVATQDITAV